jgi:integrase/recombinase XerC
MTALTHDISKLSPTGSAVALPGSEYWSLGRLIPLAESAGLFADGSVTVDEAVAFAVDRAGSAALIASSSLTTFARIWRGFSRFARLACDAPTVGSVDADVVTRYLSAATRSGRRPSPSTQRLRCSALRFLFRVLRDNGLASHDPTLDVTLPNRGASIVRPLTTPEVERCRLAAPATLLSTREPAAWALLETGGSTTEIGNIRHGHVNVVAATVVLGHDTSVERLAPLTPWGAAHLRRRRVETAATDDWVLVASSTSDGHARRTRATELVRSVMRRAGVGGEGVSARSVTVWAGRQVLDDTGRIEDVALRLGLASLDAAAALIGHDWDRR